MNVNDQVCCAYELPNEDLLVNPHLTYLENKSQRLLTHPTTVTELVNSSMYSFMQQLVSIYYQLVIINGRPRL